MRRQQRRQLSRATGAADRAADSSWVEAIDQLQDAKLHAAWMERKDDVHDAQGTPSARGIRRGVITGGTKVLKEQSLGQSSPAARGRQGTFAGEPRGPSMAPVRL